MAEVGNTLIMEVFISNNIFETPRNAFSGFARVQATSPALPEVCLLTLALSSIELPSDVQLPCETHKCFTWSAPAE